MNLFINPEKIKHLNNTYPTIYMVLYEIRSKADTRIILWHEDVEVCNDFVEQYYLKDIVHEIITKDYEKHRLEIDVLIDDNSEFPTITLTDNLEPLLRFFVPESRFLDKIDRILYSGEFTEFASGLLKYFDRIGLENLDYLTIEKKYAVLLEKMLYDETLESCSDPSGFTVNRTNGRLEFEYTEQVEKK